MTLDLLTELNRVKVYFQARTIATALGLDPTPTTNRPDNQSAGEIELTVRTHGEVDR